MLRNSVNTLRDALVHLFLVGISQFQMVRFVGRIVLT